MVKEWKPVDYDNFNFRVDIKEENHLRPNEIRVSSMLEKWNRSKKNFRFIKRFTFRHPQYPLKVDCSIVKSSKATPHGRLISEYTIQAANVLNNLETYEIEIEVDTPSVLQKKNSSINDTIGKMKKVIRFILGGIQQTNFPIGNDERDKLLKSYMTLLKKNNNNNNIRPSDFIGPSSISLEMINITPLNLDSKIPNIRHPYSVTEKADGLRKMLYIAPKGKIYLLDTNMNVQFTGCKSENSQLYHSLLDGEHVLHDKMGKFINLFLVFDIYFKHKEDVRALPFISSSSQHYSRTRLEEANNVISNLEYVSITDKEKPPLTIQAKIFFLSEGGNNIFQQCNTILDNIEEGQYSYETDGLIFTPTNKGVGSDTLGKIAPMRKITWKYSLKWKPPEYNTVDFLITTIKNAQGQDFIGNIFEDGENMRTTRQIPQFKRLTLRVGYDPAKHGYLNPCQDLIDEKYPKTVGYDRNNYKPMPFYPTNPSDPNASICNIMLKTDDYGNHYMLTENANEVFEDNTIVEFRYDSTKETFWRWIPIRVRYDKTSEYQRGLKNYGNAYHVAESVWKSIHYPITTDMLKTGTDIPDQLIDDNVYYKKSGSTITRSMRDFHNLYVKRKIIEGVAEPGETLIDMAVGKAGDMSKWIAAKLSFVFGIDVSKDNIENRKDGACARYLNYRKRYRSMPSALFIEGNSSLNIRNGEAAANQKGKEILMAIFGKGTKDQLQLGNGVYKQYGHAKDGFNIVSCQFALHYFFETQDILHNFLRNISENCKVGGYFIGTCYDGATIFEALEEKEKGESIAAYRHSKKMWEIQKEYSSADFADNQTSVGYAINVYQESINKVFKEFLVNFTYLSYLLENYGFELITREEAQEKGLPNATGLFSELFTFMEQQIERRLLKKVDVGRAENMSAEEKTVSFYNRYFIFKKKRHVESDKVLRLMIQSDGAGGGGVISTEMQDSLGKKQKKMIKKTNRRINIKNIE